MIRRHFIAYMRNIRESSALITSAVFFK